MPNSSQVCIHLHSVHPKWYPGCELFPVLLNRLSGLPLEPHLMPEIVSVSCDLHLSRFPFGFGAYHQEQSLAVRATLLSDPENYRCTLLSSWERVTVSLFYFCFRIWSNGSILPSAFCESHLNGLSWGSQ